MSSPTSATAPVIPIHAVDMHRVASTAATAEVHSDLRDALRRPLRDLRISVTDRCNFRCS